MIYISKQYAQYQSVRSALPIDEANLHNAVNGSKEMVSSLAFSEPLSQTDPLLYFGYPKEGAKHGLKAEYVMARTLQRFPNIQVQQNLKQLHANLAYKLKDMSDEALEWLLGGSRKTCRGGCANATELKAFLATNADTFQTTQLISILETILSAMGYRATQDPRQEEPVAAQTPEQIKMALVISEIMQGQMVPSINHRYDQRRSDRIQVGARLGNIETILCEQDGELSDDEDVAFCGQPINRIPAECFRVISENGQPSWIWKAKEQGVYIRNHVSGTTPLALAAATGLLKKQGEYPTAFLDCEVEARDLFTALLMPKYFRSDYHSLAEVQAGIDHFMDEHACSLDNTKSYSQEVDPKTAQRRACMAMCHAACDVHEIFSITPRRAMEDYVKALVTEEGVH